MATRVSQKNLVSGTHRTNTSHKIVEYGKASSRNNLRTKAKCLKQQMKITTTECENTDNTPKNAMDKTFCGRDENRDCNFLTKTQIACWSVVPGRSDLVIR